MGLHTLLHCHSISGPSSQQASTLGATYSSQCENGKFIYSGKWTEAHNKGVLHLPRLGLPEHRHSKVILPALQQNPRQPWLLPGPSTSVCPHHYM